MSREQAQQYCGTQGRINFMGASQRHLDVEHVAPVQVEVFTPVVEWLQATVRWLPAAFPARTVRTVDACIKGTCREVGCPT